MLIFPIPFHGDSIVKAKEMKGMHVVYSKIIPFHGASIAKAKEIKGMHAVYSKIYNSLNQVSTWFAFTVVYWIKDATRC